MRSHRVYLRQPITGRKKVSVDATTAHYLTRVLRLRVGAELVVFDGAGGEYSATLVRATRDSAQLSLGAHSPREAESTLDVTLAQGIARGERMDQVIQKATELGANRIVPLLTDHCVVRLDEKRAGRRQAHWQRIAESACEQCGRNRVPQVLPPVLFDTWLQQLDESVPGLLLQAGAASGLTDMTAPAGKIIVVIGPEGGLSAREQELAADRGCAIVSLGPRVLRTETAAMATLAVVQSLWGDAG